MMNKWLVLLALLLSCPSYAESFCTQQHDETALFHAIEQAKDNSMGDDALRANKLSAVFAACQVPQQLAQLTQLDNKTLHKLLLDINNISFFTLDAKHLAAQQQVLDEIQQRGCYVAHLAKQLYRNYVVARDLAKAHRIKQAYQLPAISEYQYQTYSGQGLLRLQQQQLVLQSNATEYPLIVVVGTGCHFSQNFIAWAEQQPNVRFWLTQHALFLLNPRESTALHSIELMQKQYPWLNLAVAYKRSEWPEIRSWATPSFYFASPQGRQSFSGWPDTGNAELLTRYMEQEGFKEESHM